MAFDPRQDAQFEELARTLSPSRRRKNLKPRSAFDSLLDYEQYLLEQGVEDDEDDSLLLRDFLTPGPGLAVGLPDSPPGGMAAWFRYGKGIEFAGAGVSRWADQTGNKRHLLQATDTNRPALQADNSILFDGVDNYLKCAAFTLVQPETVYLLGKQVTWTVSDHFFDGNAAGGGRVTQVTASPQINIDAGAGVAANSSLPVDTYAVIVAVFNGASSLLQVNNTTSTTGDAGAGNMSGFTLGASGTPGNFGNIRVKEVIIYPVAHDAATRAEVISYLAKVGNLTI